jgi:hypothetical protein
MESSLKIGSVRSLYILFAIIIIAAFCLVMSESKADGEAVDQIYITLIKWQ